MSHRRDKKRKAEAPKPPMPVRAVAADLSKQVPNNSWGGPVLFYVDIAFRCRDCGQEEVWTAEQQKWYYEQAKGSLYATAVRCHECRRRLRDERQGHGDPHPIKHAGSLMKKVHQELHPWLSQSGFLLDGKSKHGKSKDSWLDFSRKGLLLRLQFDRRLGRLIAITLDESQGERTIASVELRSLSSTRALLECIEDFTFAVRKSLQQITAETDAGNELGKSEPL